MIWSRKPYEMSVFTSSEISSGGTVLRYQTVPPQWDLVVMKMVDRDE